MKNAIKLFGIITLAAIIGFSFAACGGDGDGGGVSAKLKVINDYAEPITKVEVDFWGDYYGLKKTTSISTGESKTFTVTLRKKEDGGYVTLNLYASGLRMDMGYQETLIKINAGKTTTVTLKDDGEIE